MLSTTCLVCELRISPREDTCGGWDEDEERGASAQRTRSACASSRTRRLHEAAARAPFWARRPAAHPKSTTSLQAETWSRRKGESGCALPGDIPGGAAVPRPSSLLSRRLVVAEIASPALQPVSQRALTTAPAERHSSRAAARCHLGGAAQHNRPQAGGEAAAGEGLRMGGQGRAPHRRCSPGESRLTPAAPAPN